MAVHGLSKQAKTIDLHKRRCANAMICRYGSCFVEFRNPRAGFQKGVQDGSCGAWFRGSFIVEIYIENCSRGAGGPGGWARMGSGVERRWGREREGGVGGEERGRQGKGGSGRGDGNG